MDNKNAFNLFTQLLNCCLNKLKAFFLRAHLKKPFSNTLQISHSVNKKLYLQNNYQAFHAYFPETIFCIHTPFLTSTKPTIHFKISPTCTMAKTANTCKPVKRLRQYAMGTLTHHTNTLSNKNVMIVFPPERKVKYEACRNAFCGIKIAMIIIKYFRQFLRIQIGVIQLWEKWCDNQHD